jgi:hypothetical protein
VASDHTEDNIPAAVVVTLRNQLCNLEGGRHESSKLDRAQAGGIEERVQHICDQTSYFPWARLKSRYFYVVLKARYRQQQIGHDFQILDD